MLSSFREKVVGLGPEQRTAPYSALAAIYDHVMAHVDYDRWARYLLNLFDRHSGPISRVLDVSCGTGSLTRGLQEAGLTVYGCDASQAMVRIARDKLQPGHLWCGDIRSIGLRWSPQAVVSTYDSMNYLMSETEWLDSLRSVYGLLPAQGLFVFDISTLYNSKTSFQRYVQKERTPKGNYLRTSYYQKRGSIQINEFKIRLNQEPKRIYFEQHRQKILSLDTVHRYIAKTDFQLEGCYADFTFLPAQELAERAHFVLKKGKG
jgi:predicted TPR repeat methyltransferase